MRPNEEAAVPTAMEPRERDTEDDEDEPLAQTIILPSKGSDLCQALMDRYARSSAPQHRHLCASAAAMRSILIEESLPLTPPAYFAAAITALSGPTDSDALAALAAFLSILLPLVPCQALPPMKAKEAVFVVASILKDPPGKIATGTVRSMIKSLGFMALRVDFEDWSMVELPLETLLVFALDRRPKVRRCAQVYVEKVFRALQNSIHIKDAGKVILSMYKKHIPTAKEFTSIKCSDAAQSSILSKSGVMEFLHMLNILTLVVPYLSEKVKMKILPDVYTFLDDCFSWHTRPILNLLECLLQHSKVRVLVPESDNIILALTFYVSVGEKNPRDTIVCASTMLKNVLNKLRDSEPNICLKNLPLIVNSLAGLLGSDVTSKHAAEVLEELINVHIDQAILGLSTNQPCKVEKERTPEEAAVISICTVLDNMLGTCKVPTEYMLAVIAALFLKLGDFSYLFMKDIVLKLTRWPVSVEEDTPDMKHLHVCVGAALVAMGPEKLLSIIPISFHAETSTCSNTWLIPILKKYVVGASLQYFMDSIVPLTKSIQDASNKVKKVKVRKNLQSCSRDLWNLLPAFCRYPIDASQNFEPLAKLLMDLLKEEPSLHETIAIALQELVNGHRSMIRGNTDMKQLADPQISFVFKDFRIEARGLPFHYSKKTASRNMKALALHSLGLFQALTDIFFDSPPDKRKYMKETIGCLAHVIGGENVKHFFVSSSKKFKPLDASSESGKLEGEIQVPDKKKAKREKHEDKRCLLMDLTSCFVETANADLLNTFFEYIESSLTDTDAPCHSEAYYTLSVILKEHSAFSAARIEELMELLLCTKSSADGVTLKNRLSCFHYLLVHMLRSDEQNIDKRAFLILNEIILVLKSKKESRKYAYDLLREISCSLKNSQTARAETELLRLFNMVMGYLSSSSPHIMSGAVSALSLLIYNDASFCLAVPNLIPSVLVLLQNKDNEVIKASLGFIKVLVSSLSSNDLLKLLSDIVDGILPWLAVSKHHFRSKVGVILEILMRKFGSDTIKSIVPGKYQGFVKKIAEARQSKKNPKVDANSDAAVQSTGSDDAVQSISGQKRVSDNSSRPAAKSFKAAPRSPRDRKRTHEKDGTCQFSKSYGNSNSKDLFQARPNIRDKKYKRDAFDKPRGGDGWKTKSKKESASKSVAPSKSNKHKRARNS